MNSQKAQKESLKKQVSKGEPDVRFRTLRSRTGGAGRIVAATLRLGIGDHYLMGVAFCSPRDRFNKLKGQAIALGRLLKDPIEFERSHERPVKWSVAAITVDIAGRREVRWMEAIRPDDLV